MSTVRVCDIASTLEFVTINRLLCVKYSDFFVHPHRYLTKSTFSNRMIQFFYTFFYPFYLVKHEFSYFGGTSKSFQRLIIGFGMCVHCVYNDATSNKHLCWNICTMSSGSFRRKINKLNLNTTPKTSGNWLMQICKKIRNILNIQVHTRATFFKLMLLYIRRKKVCEIKKVWNGGFKSIYL